MAVLPIVKYGAEVLRRPTDLVTDIDDALQKLIDDMVDTMHAAPGVGLAANQIGVSRRLGYEDNGVGDQLVADVPRRSQRFRLSRERWLAGPRREVAIEGLEACLDLLGARQRARG